MTAMLQPQPGESIYDPTCGSGGMLLSAIAHLRRHGQEWRNVRLYGQERNLMTSSIARMNCFLHGMEDFRIERGDTLDEPKLVQGDRLMRFDVVLANPPYSIKQWDRDAFASDPWGRNLYGTPPQGRADYAFWQHILHSLAPKTGRCAILFPHGVLFRQEEADMRRKLIEADVMYSFPVSITQRPVAFNQDRKAIAPCDIYSADYFFNWFKWAMPAILARISDSSHGTKRLSMDDLFSMKVPSLPLTEQRKVVDQINELEVAKSAANRNAETLTTMRMAFLNSIVTY